MFICCLRAFHIETAIFHHLHILVISKNYATTKTFSSNSHSHNNLYPSSFLIWCLPLQPHRCIQEISYPLKAWFVRCYYTALLQGALFMLYSICAKFLSRVWVFVTDPMDCSPPDSYVHGIPQNTGVSYHFLFQGIFPGIKPALACQFFTNEIPNPSNYAPQHAIHILPEVVQYSATHFLLPCMIYTPDRIDLAILFFCKTSSPKPITSINPAILL